MKKIIGIATLLVITAALAGCNHHYKKKDHRSHKGNHSKSVPGDGKQAPNCAADGPGCRQYNPIR